MLKNEWEKKANWCFLPLKFSLSYQGCLKILPDHIMTSKN